MKLAFFILALLACCVSGARAWDKPLPPVNFMVQGDRYLQDETDLDKQVARMVREQASKRRDEPREMATLEEDHIQIPVKRSGADTIDGLAEDEARKTCMLEKKLGLKEGC